MSRSNTRPARRQQATSPGGPRPWAWWVAGAAAVVGATAFGYVLWMGGPAEPAGAAPAAASPAAESPARRPLQPMDPAELEAVRGRWLREDGGYLLEIRGIDASGRVEAAYFNPNPIHVARAEAFREGARLRVFVELRDAGYPGCTYTLSHDSRRDTLAGVYYQAEVGESFDVTFVRAQTGR